MLLLFSGFGFDGLAIRSNRLKAVKSRLEFFLEVLILSPPYVEVRHFFRSTFRCTFRVTLDNQIIKYPRDSDPQVPEGKLDEKCLSILCSVLWQHVLFQVQDP